MQVLKEVLLFEEVADSSGCFNPTKTPAKVGLWVTPLRAARATTIHKSQGRTVNELYLQITSGLPCGLALVDLTRCRTDDGLHLSRDFNPTGIKAHSACLAFWMSLADEAADGNVVLFDADADAIQDIRIQEEAVLQATCHQVLADSENINIVLHKESVMIPGFGKA